MSQRTVKTENYARFIAGIKAVEVRGIGETGMSRDKSACERGGFDLLHEERAAYERGENAPVYVLRMTRHRMVHFLGMTFEVPIDAPRLICLRVSRGEVALVVSEGAQDVPSSPPDRPYIPLTHPDVRSLGSSTQTQNSNLQRDGNLSSRMIFDISPCEGRPCPQGTKKPHTEGRAIFLSRVSAPRRRRCVLRRSPQ